MSLKSTKEKNKNATTTCHIIVENVESDLYGQTRPQMKPLKDKDLRNADDLIFAEILMENLISDLVELKASLEKIKCQSQSRLFDEINLHLYLHRKKIISKHIQKFKDEQRVRSFCFVEILLLKCEHLSFLCLSIKDNLPPDLRQASNILLGEFGSVLDSFKDSLNEWGFTTNPTEKDTSRIIKPVETADVSTLVHINSKHSCSKSPSYVRLRKAYVNLCEQSIALKQR